MTSAPVRSGRTESLSEQRRALIAQRLKRVAATETPVEPAIPRLPEEAQPPISFGQERLWFMEQLNPGTDAYHMRAAVRLRGPMDVAALRVALDDVAGRHDSLRMSFPVTGDGRPVVHVAESVSVPFRTTTLDAADGDVLGRTRQLSTEDAKQPFDLTTAPLLRGMAIEIGPDDHVIHVAMHHIISDGWSRQILLRDWADCYAARIGERPVPPPPAIRYGDFAAWQRERLAGPAADADLTYWRAALAGVAPLEMPTDRPRPAVMDPAAAGYKIRFADELVERLRLLGRDHGATLFMTMLAGLHTVLYRWTGQRDFAVGSPVAGRIRTELEPVFGLFVNMLTYPAGIREPMTFAELLDQTRDRAVAALSHQEVPFERLVQDLRVERDTSRTPLFQVLFGMHNYEGPAGTWPGGLSSSRYGLQITSTRHDLSLYVDERADGFWGVFGYRTDLFDPATVARFGDHFQRVLAAVVADPHRPLSELDLMSAAERKAVLGFGASQAVPLREGATLAELTAAHAAATPDAPALFAAGTSVSYRELDDSVSRMAAWLAARGVGGGDLVAVCLDQSPELATVLLGVLRAGAAYVPLDAEQPPARLASMVDDCRPALILTTSDLAGRFGDAPVVCLDQTPIPEGEAPPVCGPRPDDLAYVIYTSGSTGRPKGVAVAHRQVMTYLAGVADRFEAVPGARWALPQSLAFDFALTTFYLGLSTGGCVHLVPRRCTGPELAAYLREHRIDYLKMTPSHLAALAADVPAGELVPARALVLGGEASRLDWAAGLASGKAAVHNHYGPTEATVGVTTHRVSPSDSGAGTTPIGSPLPHARVYVLDAKGRPVPVGLPGEIHLGGDRLARGYLGQPGLTADRFRPDPYSDAPGARMYATGDLGRWRADGQLEFLGRRDGQVKLRGYRVELGEVEAAMVALAGVAAAVAVVRDDRLIGYLQRFGSSTQDTDEPTLRRLLAEVLPDYMVPQRFVWLDLLPLQEHGKVDRRALPDPGAIASTVEFVPPDGPVETVIAGVWAQVLGLESVGVLDDFFDLGGHSLLATQVVARLRRVLDEGLAEQPISVMDLFRHRTVRALAALVHSGGADSRLLHELTPPPTGRRIRSYVCVPYGGANAVVYQPLADALPDGHSLYAVAVPGHDIGLSEETEPIEETAARCVAEILATVTGPLVLYGHCGPGGALAVEIARRLEAAGRDLDALYLGGIFPFARPTGGLLGRLSGLRLRERLRGDRVYANWLQGMGADLGALDEEQQRFLVRAMRQDARMAEDYFTELLHRREEPLRTPIVCVVGDRDPGTEYHEERYREWQFLSDTTALVVLAEAGHYFSKFRADELADIITGTDARLAESVPVAEPGATWWLDAVSHRTVAEAEAGPKPGMRRFTAVAAGQIVSATGSALTTFAVPLWTYLDTGSLIRFALFAVLGQVPGILVAPIAGAIVDRSNRRGVMLAANLAAGSAIATFSVLYWTDAIVPWQIYAIVAWLSVALTFQRLAYMSAVPQLVPKRYLGHANGMVQLSGGVAQFLVPLVAVGLMATIGLGGILLVDLVSYLFALTVLLLVKFPNTMARVRRESLGAEIAGGLRYTVRHRGFRAMVLFFAAFNLFLAPLFLLLSPLVLSFTTLAGVAQVSLAGGIGAVVGALTMTAWGGPRHRRMRGMLLMTFAFAAGGLVTGLRPSVATVAVGAFLMSMSLAIINGIWLTIIQTKVPQRLHARVIALNMVIALSTMPLGQAVVAPLLVPWVEPWLLANGPLASTVGTVLGVGPGRGTGLLYVLLAVAVAVVVAVSLRVRTLARFDDEVPDALPDDLVGLRTLRKENTDGR